LTLTLERFDDVVRLRMQGIGTRAAGLDVSAYLVRGILVDTGFHRARREMDAAIASLTPRGAVVTHWHEDHAGNAERLAGRGLPLWMHGSTEQMLRRRPAIRLYRRLVWGRPPKLRSTLTSIELEDLQVIHAPGHSFDHHVVWDPRTSTLFSGDLWLGVRASIMHEAEEPSLIVRSLRAAARLEPRRMFDAHRGPVENPTAALLAKAEWLEQTIGEITRRLNEGWSERQIVQRVLGGEAAAGYASGGEYARRNLVRAVRRNLSSAP
jgi:glyoxylase-like metal-dependent hydrolase (beta-lactamase superfamily II)